MAEVECDAMAKKNIIIFHKVICDAEEGAAVLFNQQFETQTLPKAGIARVNLISFLTTVCISFFFFFFEQAGTDVVVVYIQVWRACSCTNSQHEWLLTIGYVFSFAFMRHICLRSLKKSQKGTKQRRTLGF